MSQALLFLQSLRFVRLQRPASSRRRASKSGATWLAAGLLACSFSASAMADGGPPPSPSTEGTVLYIITPEDGATLSSPVTVRFGLQGMGVAPAGVQKAGTGHHHLIIDAPVPPAGRPVPADANHIHFGGGQTETTIELAPGTHTLQLLLADHQHMPHDPPVVSEVVTIEVVE